MLLEQEVIARAQAENTPPGLHMFTDGLRPEDAAVLYPIVRNNGQSSMAIKTHVGHNQEAYGVVDRRPSHGTGNPSGTDGG